jgi:hypothetical protein
MKTKNFTIESETRPVIGVIATFRGINSEFREAHVFLTENECVAAICSWGALEDVLFVVPQKARFEGSKRWESSAAQIVQKGRFLDRSEQLVRAFVAKAIADAK